MQRRAVPPVNLISQRAAFAPPSGIDAGASSRPVAQAWQAPALPGAITADPWHMQNLVEIPFVVGTTSIQVLPPSDSPRNGLGFRNSGATNIYVSFGAPASLNSWLKLTAGQIIFFDVGVSQNDVNAFSDAAGGGLIVAFSTMNGG